MRSSFYELHDASDLFQCIWAIKSNAGWAVVEEACGIVEADIHRGESTLEALENELRELQAMLQARIKQTKEDLDTNTTVRNRVTAIYNNIKLLDAQNAMELAQAELKAQLEREADHDKQSQEREADHDKQSQELDAEIANTDAEIANKQAALTAAESFCRTAKEEYLRELQAELAAAEANFATFTLVADDAGADADTDTDVAAGSAA